MGYMNVSSDNIKAAWSGRKNRPAWLLVTLFALLLIYPAFEGLSLARIVLNIFFSLILISSALAMWRQKRQALIGVCLGVPAIALGWLKIWVDFGPVGNLITQGVTSGFILYIAISQVIKALSNPRVTHNTLCRGVSAYILLRVAWAGFYQINVLIDPLAITPPLSEQNWAASLYFSFTVLTTLGFGDIVPVSAYARSLVMIESIIAPMYLAVLIARFVAMHRRYLPTAK